MRTVTQKKKGSRKKRVKLREAKEREREREQGSFNKIIGQIFSCSDDKGKEVERDSYEIHFSGDPNTVGI